LQPLGSDGPTLESMHRLLSIEAVQTVDAAATATVGASQAEAHRLARKYRRWRRDIGKENAMHLKCNHSVAQIARALHMSQVAVLEAIDAMRTSAPPDAMCAEQLSGPIVFSGVSTALPAE